MSMTIAEQLIQQGRLEGKIEGKLEGLREGESSLRQAVEDLCEVFGIEVDDARRTQLAELDLAGLDALRVALKQKRAWPESPSSLVGGGRWRGISRRAAHASAPEPTPAAAPEARATAGGSQPGASAPGLR